MTLTKALQTQEQLWTSLSNPSAALLELAGEALLLSPRRPGKGLVGSLKARTHVMNKHTALIGGVTENQKG